MLTKGSTDAGRVVQKDRAGVNRIEEEVTDIQREPPGGMTSAVKLRLRRRPLSCLPEI